MANRPIEEDTPPTELTEKFGADAEIYADVRAEAAAAAGRPEAAQKWERKADQLNGGAGECDRE